jgi:hypothetical protein
MIMAPTTQFRGSGSETTENTPTANAAALLELQMGYRPGDIVKFPTSSDILLGKTALTLNHPGNKKFREFIAQHHEEFEATLTKNKQKLGEKFVATLKMGGSRFLREVAGGWWEVVDDEKARIKLTEGFRTRRKKDPKAAMLMMGENKILSNCAPKCKRIQKYVQIGRIDALDVLQSSVDFFQGVVHKERAEFGPPTAGVPPELLTLLFVKIAGDDTKDFFVKSFPTKQDKMRALLNLAQQGSGDEDNDDAGMSVVAKTNKDEDSSSEEEEEEDGEDEEKEMDRYSDVSLKNILTSGRKRGFVNYNEEGMEVRQKEQKKSSPISRPSVARNPSSTTWNAFVLGKMPLTFRPFVTDCGVDVDTFLETPSSQMTEQYVAWSAQQEDLPTLTNAVAAATLSTWKPMLKEAIENPIDYRSKEMSAEFSSPPVDDPVFNRMQKKFRPFVKALGMDVVTFLATPIQEMTEPFIAWHAKNRLSGKPKGKLQAGSTLSLYKSAATKVLKNIPSNKKRKAAPAPASRRPGAAAWPVETQQAKKKRKATPVKNKRTPADGPRRPADSSPVETEPVIRHALLEQEQSPKEEPPLTDEESFGEERQQKKHVTLKEFQDLQRKYHALNAKYKGLQNEFQLLQETNQALQKSISENETNLQGDDHSYQGELVEV